MEFFIPIKKYGGYYKISNERNVLSCSRIIKSKRKKGNSVTLTRDRILKPEISNNGYKRVTLVKKTIKKRYLIHRLVAEAFIKNPGKKPCVNHKNGIKTDNQVKNLEWCTHSENEHHSYKQLGKTPHNKKS